MRTPSFKSFVKKHFSAYSDNIRQIRYSKHRFVVVQYQIEHSLDMAHVGTWPNSFIYSMFIIYIQFHVKSIVELGLQSCSFNMLFLCNGSPYSERPL